MKNDITEILKLVVATPGNLRLKREPYGNRIYGFQFDVQGFNLVGIICPQFDFIQIHNETVFALSLTGQYIAEGQETICELIYDDHFRVGKIKNLVLSGYGGLELTFSGRLFTPLPIGEHNPFTDHPIELNDGDSQKRTK